MKKKKMALGRKLVLRKELITDMQQSNIIGGDSNVGQNQPCGGTLGICNTEDYTTPGNRTCNLQPPTVTCGAPALCAEGPSYVSCEAGPGCAGATAQCPIVGNPG